MNPYPFFGAIILITASLGYGFWERGNAESWENKYNQRVSLEQTAADKARVDAQKQEAADLANLKSQSSQAIFQATSQKEQAQKQLAVYQEKIKKASGEKDLPHLCAGVLLPEDLRP